MNIKENNMWDSMIGSKQPKSDYTTNVCPGVLTVNGHKKLLS